MSTSAWFFQRPGSSLCAKSQTCISLVRNNCLCSWNALQAKLKMKTHFVRIVKTQRCGHGAVGKESPVFLIILVAVLQSCGCTSWPPFLELSLKLSNSALSSSYFHCQNPLLNDSRMPASTLTYYFFALADLSLEQNLEKSCDSVIWKCFMLQSPKYTRHNCIKL